MNEAKPYWMQVETVANSICRLSAEGKSFSEIFNLIVEKNRENGFNDFETLKQRHGLIHGIRSILGMNFFYTTGDFEILQDHGFSFPDLEEDEDEEEDEGEE